VARIAVDAIERPGPMVANLPPHETYKRSANWIALARRKLPRFGALFGKPQAALARNNHIVMVRTEPKRAGSVF